MPGSARLSGALTLTYWSAVAHFATGKHGHVRAYLADCGAARDDPGCTVLAQGDHPEWYGLPRDPHVPLSIRFLNKWLRPLGVVAILAAIAGAFAHYSKFGPKVPPAEGKRAEGDRDRRPS